MHLKPLLLASVSVITQPVAFVEFTHPPPEPGKCLVEQVRVERCPVATGPAPLDFADEPGDRPDTVAPEQGRMVEHPVVVVALEANSLGAGLGAAALTTPRPIRA